jgi:hypothetical protein
VQSGTDRRFPSTEEVFDPATTPGLGQQASAPFGAAELLADWRDHDVYGESGGMLGVGLTRFGELVGDDRFSRVQADLRQVLRLGSTARALALRGYISLSIPDDGGQVPFYLMEGLGGHRGLRAYDPFRFRAERLLLLQAEYRWEVSRTFQLVAFYDAGQAVRDGEDFGALRDSYGGGLRLKTESASLARFVVARGDEGTRLVVAFGGSF